MKNQFDANDIFFKQFVVQKQSIQISINLQYSLATMNHRERVGAISRHKSERRTCPTVRTHIENPGKRVSDRKLPDPEFNR